MYKYNKYKWNIISGFATACILVSIEKMSTHDAAAVLGIFAMIGLILITAKQKSDEKKKNGKSMAKHG